MFHQSKSSYRQLVGDHACSCSRPIRGSRSAAIPCSPPLSPSHDSGLVWCSMLEPPGVFASSHASSRHSHQEKARLLQARCHVSLFPGTPFGDLSGSGPLTQPRHCIQGATRSGPLTQPRQWIQGATTPPLPGIHLRGEFM